MDTNIVKVIVVVVILGVNGLNNMFAWQAISLTYLLFLLEPVKNTLATTHRIRTVKNQPYIFCKDLTSHTCPLVNETKGSIISDCR